MTKKFSVSGLRDLINAYLEPDLDNTSVGKLVLLHSKREVRGLPAIFFRRFFMVRVNGELLEIQGQILENYIKGVPFDIARIAVERNGRIVPRTEYGRIILENGDNIEIVSFVGGG